MQQGLCVWVCIYINTSVYVCVCVRGWVGEWVAWVGIQFCQRRAACLLVQVFETFFWRQLQRKSWRSCLSTILRGPRREIPRDGGPRTQTPNTRLAGASSGVVISVDDVSVRIVVVVAVLFVCCCYGCGCGGGGGGGGGGGVRGRDGWCHRDPGDRRHAWLLWLAAVSSVILLVVLVVAGAVVGVVVGIIAIRYHPD